MPSLCSVSSCGSKGDDDSKSSAGNADGDWGVLSAHEDTDGDWGKKELEIPYVDETALCSSSPPVILRLKSSITKAKH